MGRVALIMVLVVSTVLSIILVNANTHVRKVPEMLAANFQDLGSYALQFAFKQIKSGDISESTSEDYTTGNPFNVLDGSINGIQYIFTEIFSGIINDEMLVKISDVNVIATVSVAANGDIINHDSRAKFTQTIATIISGEGGSGNPDEDGGEINGNEESYDLSGNLNINPGNSSGNEFQMETPSGRIDRTQIHNNAPEFTYNGTATVIRIKPKAQGRTLTINGTLITLSTNTRYTIISDNMNVYLRNDKIKKGKAMGEWWISINASEATINPKPEGIPGGDQGNGGDNGNGGNGEGGFIDEYLNGPELKVVYWKP